MYIFGISRFYFALIFIFPLFLYEIIKFYEKKEYPLHEIVFDKYFLIFIKIFTFFLLSIMGFLVYFNKYSFKHLLIYYILVILLFFILTIQILKIKINPMFFLLEIGIFGILLRIHNYFSYDGIIGVDPHYHFAFICDMLSSNYLPIGELYYFFPLFHIEVAYLSLLLSMGLKFSYFLISIIQLIVIVLFIYLLGKELCNTQIGLLGSLFAIISPAIQENNITIVPSTLAVGFFVILIFFLFKKKNEEYLVIILLITIALIFTHHLSSFIYMIWIILFVFFYLFFNRFLKKITIDYKYLILICIFIIFYWSISFTETIGSATFFDGVINSLKSVLMNIDNGSDFKINTIYNISIPVYKLFYIDLFNLITISLVVLSFFLIWQNKSRFFVLGAITTMLIFAVLGASTLGISQIIPQRWFYFSSCISAIPVSYSICRIFRCKSKLLYFLGFFLIFLIGIAGILHPYGTISNPIIQDDNIATRLGCLDSEIFASKFITENNEPKTIFTDIIYSSEVAYTSYSPTLSRKNKIKIVYPPDLLTYNSGIILIRNQNRYYSGPYASGLPPVIVTEKFFTTFESNSYEKIYNNKGVDIFLVDNNG